MPQLFVSALLDMAAREVPVAEVEDGSAVPNVGGHLAAEEAAACLPA
jgi:hypothetical protein